MTNDTLLTVIGGIIILFFVIFSIVYRLKTKPSAVDKQKAEEFLEGLSGAIYKKMIDIVNNVDINKYESLMDFEANVIADIHVSIKEYIQEKLEENLENDFLSALTLKVIDEDFIKSFIDKVIYINNINTTIESRYSTKSEELVESIEEEEKELNDKFSSDEYNEDFDTNDLPPASNQEPTAEELAALNPPKEEDDGIYNEDDISVEEIEDDTYIDTRGRRRSKKTGRYV